MCPFWMIRINDHRSIGSWCIKETRESNLRNKSLVLLMHDDLTGLIFGSSLENSPSDNRLIQIKLHICDSVVSSCFIFLINTKQKSRGGRNASPWAMMLLPSRLLISCWQKSSGGNKMGYTFPLISHQPV